MMSNDSFKLLMLVSVSVLDVATATFSIAGTDRSNNQIGAAGASCVYFSVYEALYQGVPGHGVLITQAQPPEEGSPVYSVGTSLLENNTDPSEIITAITNPALDDGNTTITTVDTNETIVYQNVNLRQYGCVDLQERSDGYTGSDIKDYYDNLGLTEDIFGPYGESQTSGKVLDVNNTLYYTAQGNAVTYNTVSNLAKSFEELPACDLVDRLYQSLASVFMANTEDSFMGDVRCKPNSAGGAFLHVEDEVGNVIFHHDVVGGNNFTEVDPFPALQEAYENWRIENPCPEGTTSFTEEEIEDGSGSDTTTETSSAFDDVAWTWNQLLFAGVSNFLFVAI